jgi:predicted permease
LFSDGTILIVAAIVIAGWYLAAFLVARLFFGHSRQEAGIARLSAGVSAVGFLRIVVLGSLFGAEAALTVAVAALVVNLALVPVAVTLVAPAGTKAIGHADAGD